MGREYHTITEMQLVESDSEHKHFSTGTHDHYQYEIERDHLHMCNLDFDIRSNGSITASFFVAKNRGPDDFFIQYWFLDENGERLHHSPPLADPDQGMAGPSRYHIEDIPDTPNSHRQPAYVLKLGIPRSLFPLVQNIELRAYA